MSKNKFGLVYQGAITDNEEGKVNIHPVAYMLNGIRIAANVYTPAESEETASWTAIRQTSRQGCKRQQKPETRN